MKHIVNYKKNGQLHSVGQPAPATAPPAASAARAANPMHHVRLHPDLPYRRFCLPRATKTFDLRTKLPRAGCPPTTLPPWPCTASACCPAAHSQQWSAHSPQPSPSAFTRLHAYQAERLYNCEWRGIQLESSIHNQTCQLPATLSSRHGPDCWGGSGPIKPMFHRS